ncbi:MAG: AraC family transcriptional regulator [Rhodoferax sp.]
MPSSKARTPLAFVRAIVHAYTQRGISPARALAAAQIDPASVDEPLGCITALQFERLSAAAMQELDDEALGWFSRRLPWGSYGMLARASLSAPTLEVALKRWCRHHGLLTDDVRLSLSITPAGQARLAITEHRVLGAVREFALVSLLRNALGLASWLIDSRIALSTASFPFEVPAHAAAYPVLFPAPAQFEQAQAAIEFDSQYLAQPLRRDEAAMRQMLQRALPLQVLGYRRDRLLVQSVRQALAQTDWALRTAHAVAAHLAMSPRTLHRQLREEGTHLQALKDEVRFERAQALLLRTDRPIKQIAHAAGFANEKSFIRAFQARTGISPTQYRKAAHRA